MRLISHDLKSSTLCSLAISPSSLLELFDSAFAEDFSCLVTSSRSVSCLTTSSSEAFKDCGGEGEERGGGEKVEEEGYRIRRGEKGRAWRRRRGIGRGEGRRNRMG